MPNIAIVLPFRDRGTDPLRQANYDRVLAHWHQLNAQLDAAIITSTDNRAKHELFNRSAAYNNAIDNTTADVLVFAEADMLINFSQIKQGIDIAATTPGLVIPFTRYCYLTPEDSQQIREYRKTPAMCMPQSEINHGASIGAINIASRRTIRTIGRFDETFEGSWWDDRAMFEAFRICAGPPAWVSGPAWHLYHQPGWAGDHLTPQETKATARNAHRYHRYQQANTAAEIHALTE